MATKMDASSDDEDAAAVISPQATRVESLFHLIKLGSSADVRANAAEKLGEIALQSPVYCRSILQQIRLLVVDVNWDVRVAAAQCVAVIARSFRAAPPAAVALSFAHASFAGRETSCPRLNFRTVDVQTVLSDGAPLLRSGGEEYQYESNLSEDQRRVAAVRQRQLLLRRICGASASSDGMWQSREDELAQQMLPRLNADHVKELAADIEASEATADVTFAVEETRKRAAEMLPVTTKKAKTDHDSEQEDDSDHGQILGLVARLVVDLFESVFDAKWEVRHGSLACLRHVLLSSGWIAGLQQRGEAATSAVVDQWIEESIMRCLCVLALDQFVDYSADGSVGPVRELSAQVFGILLGSLHDPELLMEYIVVLRKLLVSPGWHASHGGLLGIKYLVQAHATHASTLVPLVIHDVVKSLHRSQRTGAEEEDIMVVAAGVLGDAVNALGAVDPTVIAEAASALWAIVTETSSSGLSASTAVQTLRLWYSYDYTSKLLRVQLDPLLMWTNLIHVVPLMHHHGSSIRISAAACIEALANADTAQPSSTSQQISVVKYLLPHVLLQLLREEEEKVRDKISSCWKAVVEWCSSSGSLVAAVENDLSSWIELLWVFEGVGELNVSARDDAQERLEDSLSLPSRDNLASRVAFADAMGMLVSRLPVESRCYEATSSRVEQALASRSGDQQCGALLLISRWAIHANRHPDPCTSSALHLRFGPLLESMAKRDWVPVLAASSNGSVYYAEQEASLKRVLRMQASLVEIFRDAGIKLNNAPRAALSSAQLAVCSSAAAASREVAERIATFPYESLNRHAEAFEQAHFRRQDLFLVDDVIQQGFALTSARIQGVGSCAFCELLQIPPKKSGFLVKSLMESIKTEANPTFQALTAEAMARFVVSQVDIQLKCVTKIISNLCNSAVALAYQTQASPDSAAPLVGDETALQKLRVRIRGAESALQAIVRVAGAHFEKLPLLREITTRGWSAVDVGGHTRWTDKIVQENAHLVAVLAPAMTNETTTLKWIHKLCKLSTADFQVEQTRRAVAKALATVCQAAFGAVQGGDESNGEQAMEILYTSLFSSAHAPASQPAGESDRRLAGAVMVLDELITSLETRLTPYVPSLVHFAMKAMHAAQSHVRGMAAKAFADLLPLLPLQMDLEEPRHQTKLRQVLQDNQSSRAFLDSLLQGKAISEVDVSSVLSKAFTLRDYQQHGVNWLTFLAENRMGGVLADDMGLGKTIQVLATIAAHSPRSEHAVSLVVCPPIIVHHWITEARRCFPDVFANVIDYSGPAATRKALLDRTLNRNQSSKPSLLVTTYAITRSDCQLLRLTPFDFVVLDEAHLIRNPKSALFQAACSLQASHRFVLSGTPLQNHVGDLWSLFSFLMPGYLGEYADFRRDFELPISRSRERSATPKQKELAALAINKLHQRVLPFILRRTKDEVLKELPPKIVSNVLLRLTPMQQRLYTAASTPSHEGNANNTATPMAGVLRNLQLLKRICVHPTLVKDSAIVTPGDRKSIDGWKQSGKMVGLHDLLVESCDLGRSDSSDADEDVMPLCGSHRCLVFAHLKETLDVIEDMFGQALPRLSHMRLDGTTPSSKRHEIVRKFNDDPSIDVLLLTTAVGGLGLTLTGADTVIFVEHSWNPFVDLQAMDRAHRIGQKKTVRVFRLIMEGSLEEHIMDLQAFKERVASTVVTTADASTGMDANTKNVLQLLQTSSTAVKAQEAAALARAEETKRLEADDLASGSIPGAAVELLNQIGELWDQSQYDSLAFPGIA